MIRPTASALDFAAEWLRSYDGDAADQEKLESVASYLDQQAHAENITAIAAATKSLKGRVSALLRAKHAETGIPVNEIARDLARIYEA